MNNYLQNIKDFYSWFSEHESEVRDLMNQGQFEESANMMKKELSLVFPSIEFQLLKKQNQYILEINTLLQSWKKIVFSVFCEYLPTELQKEWVFYYYHPAFKGDINIGSVSVSGAEVIIYEKIQERTQKIDIKFEARKLEKLPQQEQFMAIYLLLADYLGELAVEFYIGSISRITPFEKLKLSKKSRKSLTEYSEIFKEQIKEYKWVPPEEIRLISEHFTQKTNSTDYRKDIIHGVSYSIELLEAMDLESSEIIDFVYASNIALYTIVFDKQEMSNPGKAKTETKKLLQKKWLHKKRGFIVTDASGNRYEYLDVLLFDDSYDKLNNNLKNLNRGIEIIEMGQKDD